MLMPKTETLVAFIVTLFVEEAENLATSAEVGTAPLDQFPVVNQLLSAPPPVQLIVAAETLLIENIEFRI